MRLIPWRAMQPDDPASLADKAQLHERLARLTGGVAPTAAAAPVQPTPAETVPAEQEIAPAQAAAQPAAEPIAEPVAEPVEELVAAAAPSIPAAATQVASAEPDRRRRRRFGFVLFFGALILVFFLVRAIPADWEIGPFRIDASGNAADTAASLYFSDDPHAPFWLLVPTFNLPPRF
ncbi:MAG: hypothetical protein E6J32_12405, partial [Chloroflexi bacterium]